MTGFQEQLVCVDEYLELRRCLMKTVLLHGLGQTAQDWKEVVQQLSISDVDCPELFSSAEDEISYSQILGDLEQRYSEVKEPFRICGLSLGALLAIDFAIRHEEKVASLVLIGAQYKVPSLLIDFQNLIFRCMPNKAFESREMGIYLGGSLVIALVFGSILSVIVCRRLDAVNHCITLVLPWLFLLALVVVLAVIYLIFTVYAKSELKKTSILSAIREE